MKDVLDFVIIGAQKSGTTHLVSAINRTQKAHVRPSEARCFRDPFYPDLTPVGTFLSGAPEDRLAGIKHPAYLGRPEVPERLYRYNPKLKIIAILRDPVDRAISCYLHFLRAGAIPCVHPNDGLLHILDNPTLSPKYQDIREFSRYAKYLRMYQSYFDKSQILIFTFENYLKSKIDIKLQNFLQIPDFRSDWPAINAGSYDWDTCVKLHKESRESKKYDEYNNVIWDNKSKIIQKKQIIVNNIDSNIVIDESILKRMRNYYSDDIKLLNYYYRNE